jgi:hypothetical protein
LGAQFASAAFFVSDRLECGVAFAVVDVASLCCIYVSIFGADENSGVFTHAYLINDVKHRSERLHLRFHQRTQVKIDSTKGEEHCMLRGSGNVIARSRSHRAVFAAKV